MTLYVLANSLRCSFDQGDAVGRLMIATGKSYLTWISVKLSLKRSASLSGCETCATVSIGHCPSRTRIDQSQVRVEGLTIRRSQLCFDVGRRSHPTECDPPLEHP